MGSWAYPGTAKMEPWHHSTEIHNVSSETMFEGICHFTLNKKYQWQGDTREEVRGSPELFGYIMNHECTKCYASQSNSF